MPVRKITILDVAKHAGVSQGTVSRVLSDTGYIKPSTRKKVEEAVRELKYIPNRAGRTLKTTRTGLIMLAIPDIGNNIYAGMIEGVNEVARQYDCSMVLYFTNGTLSGELDAVRMLQEHLVDGLFLVHFSYDERLRNEIERCGAPVALCGMCTSLWAKESDKGFSTLSIDVYNGIYNMTMAMIQKGHARIGYLAGAPGIDCYQQRYKAFCDAMRDGGREIFPEDVFWHDYTKQHGRNAAAALAARDAADRPNAIVASNDLQALGFWQGCVDRGMSVPGDIALSGMDDLDEMKMLNLCSIRMMENEVGASGAHIILDQLEKGIETAPCVDLSYEPELVMRSSI